VQVSGSRGRYVLSLTSSLNIRLWEEGEYEAILNKMNLTYVKHVKFVGNNYSVGCSGGGGLINGYKSIMENVFLCKQYVRKLDISIDSSEECSMLLNRLKEMPCLEELCLRSSGFIAQWNQTRPTLNEVISDTLEGLEIKSLELKGFSMPEYDIVGIKIFSHSIQYLKLEYGKEFEIETIEAANLRKIEIASRYWTFCFYHAQCMVNGYLVDDASDPPGRLAKVLAEGCPRLEKYNDMDLTSLGQAGSWLQALRHHKGEGLNGDDNFCAQCLNWEERRGRRRTKR